MAIPTCQTRNHFPTLGQTVCWFLQIPATNLGTISRSGTGGTATIAFTGNGESNVTWGNITATEFQVAIESGRSVTFLDTLETTTTRTLVNHGTLQLGDGGSTGFVEGDIINTGILRFHHDIDMQYTHSITGSGSLEKLGLQSLSLSGQNQFLGGVIVDSGILHLTSVAELEGSVLVNNGGTLNGSGLITGSVTLMSGGSIFSANRLEPLTINGDFTASGGSIIDIDLLTDGMLDVGLHSSSRFHMSGLSMFHDDVVFRLFDDEGLQAHHEYTVTFAKSGGMSGGSSRFIVISGTGAFPSFTNIQVQESGGNLQLRFTPVPEPGFVVMLGAAAIGFTLLPLRRRMMVPVAFHRTAEM